MLKSDNSIVILRVLGMIMIVICHIGSYIQYPVVTQFFNVGVQLFLFISGWLYSEKKIENPKVWLRHRWLKLCLPMYMWIMIIVLCLIITDIQKVDIKNVCTYLLNLQGIDWFLPIRVSVLPGTIHLWFLTAIMSCYLVTILHKRIEKGSLKRKTIFKVISIEIICLIVLAYIGIWIEFLFIYFVGYYLARIWKKVKKRDVIVLTVFMLIAVTVRLIAHGLCDGTILYEKIVAALTHNVIAIWIFAMIKYMDEQTTIIKQLCKNKYIQYCEGLSFYIYITHYTFINPKVDHSMITSSKVLWLLVAIVMSIVSAVILKWCYQKCEVVLRRYI